jgi:hypothetical protein
MARVTMGKLARVTMGKLARFAFRFAMGSGLAQRSVVVVVWVSLGDLRGVVVGDWGAVNWGMRTRVDSPDLTHIQP